ncbi:MAG: glutamate 5-kinase [Mariprofundaceae bacterium]
MVKSRSDFNRIRRIVIKVGSSLLTDEKDGVRHAMIQRLAVDIANMREQGTDVVLVSSGAVALGRVHMNWIGRRLSVHEKQAAAATGQPSLMHAYEQAFAACGLKVAQMLLTKDDLRHRRRYLNASNTTETLFSAGVIPIVNENDAVVVEEIKFGDNDSLSCLVSLLVNADLLVMLTDVDGLYEQDPAINKTAKRLSSVAAITPEVLAMAGGGSGKFGTGGMGSKLHAARVAMRGGVTVAIIDGHREESLRCLLAGKDEGTVFLCGADRQNRRKHWIAEVLRPEGKVWIDQGAENALIRQGSSLLPVGVTNVEGTFDKGECIEICGPSGVIAKGLSNYNKDELFRVKGISSNRIESILGYRDFSAVVHRDNLVLL